MAQGLVDLYLAVDASAPLSPQDDWALVSYEAVLRPARAPRRVSGTARGSESGLAGSAAVDRLVRHRGLHPSRGVEMAENKL